MKIIILSLLLVFTICGSIEQLPLHYGSLVRIKSSGNHFLHSHRIPLQPDGPFSVTGFWLDDDANSLWSLQQPYSTSRFSSKSYKDPIRCSDNISLIHSLTGGSLQTFEGSVGMTQPQQWVTNSQQPLQSNSNWMIQCVNSKDKQVKFGTQFRLKHLNTNKYVQMAKENVYDDINCGRGCIIKNHIEIHAVKEANPQTVLSAVGGVTFIN